MHYFFEDLAGVTAATLLCVLLLLLPGFAIAQLLNRRGWIRSEGPLSTCWGIVLGPAVLPAIDALLLRWLGFGCAIFIHAALAAAGIRPAVSAARRVPLKWWWAVAGCFAAAAWANVDFDWNGHLFQPLGILDSVKHAAVIGALATKGVPLHDPFFARPGIAGYYYYFYIGPALIHWLAAPLIDSRCAFAGATFTILLAFPALLILVAEDADLIPAGSLPRFIKLICLLCCVSGLDLLPGLWIWATTGTLLAQLDWWSEEVRWALTSILWVPHHINALVAVYVGSILVSRGERDQLVPRAAFASFAFATAFGCSVWIAIAAAPILTIWWLAERKLVGTKGMWALPLASAGALLWALPQIFDIKFGRAVEGFPLALYMRPVGPVRVLPHSVGEWIVHLAVLPGGYLVEFGIFAIGSVAFLMRGRFSETRSTPLGRLLLLSVPIALVLVTFVRSAILFNDFGWRAMWLAQVPAIVWTGSVISTRREVLRSPIWRFAAALGLVACVWDVAGLRLMRPKPFLPFINEDPKADFDIRGAYRWADRNIPATVIIQHNPTAGRALDFGLYSDRQVALADSEARLFGAPEAKIESRLNLLMPIFERPMLQSEIRERARRVGVGGLLLTSNDPLWRASGGPPSGWTCDYRASETCIMLLGKLQ